MQHDTVFPIIGLLLLNIAIVSGQTGDPCTDSTTVTLPGLTSRYLNNVVQPFAIDVDDNTLVPGWYKTEGISMLIQSPTDIYQCGTKYPIWLQGPLPQAVNEVVDVTGCTWSLSHDCYPQVAITIKKCPNNEFVYLLRATPTRESGYCFGVDPIVPPVIRDVTFELTSKTMAGNGRDYTQVDFICNFQQSSTGQNQYYRVRWYENGVEKYVSPYADSSQLANLRLSESLFVANGFQLGNHISCDVELSYQPSGTAIATSERSTQLFVGIEILTPSLIFRCHAEDTVARTVRVRHTLPIGCSGVSSCEIDLNVLVEGAACQHLGVPGDSCGMKIQSTTVIGTDIEVVLTCTSTGIYLQSVVDYDVYLRTDTLENEIWRNYIVGPIHVRILPPENQVVFGKRCQSNNDPHMMSGDQRTFELQTRYHQPGTFILYQNKEMQAEVQVKFRRCCGHCSALCNTALAVQYRQDLYVIDLKANPPMDYKACGDGLLQVKSVNENLYRIFMPYGTYVETIISVYSAFLSKVHVYFSQSDYPAKSYGLCGPVDDDTTNDFTDINYQIQTHIKFIESWRVTENSKNMFEDTFVLGTPEPTDSNTCVCAHETGNPQWNVECRKNPAADCSNGNGVSQHNCQDLSPGTGRRKRRSVGQFLNRPIVDVSKSQLEFRSKRNAHWTLPEATTFCNEYFGNSVVYDLCLTVPNAGTVNSLEDCIKDIMLSGGTDWANTTMENMRSTCVSELDKNTSLSESQINGVSLAQSIKKIACPNDCSGRGTCNYGCSCEPGYGGGDCSISIHDSIHILGMLGDGLCDEQTFWCTEIAWISGFPIVHSALLKCRLVEFIISNNGSRQFLARTLVTGIFSTIVEAGCPLKSSAPPGYFAHGFTISISNDGGKTLSQEQDLIMYNSACQEHDTDASGHLTAKLKDDCCFIEGSCYNNWNEDGRSNCYTCLSYLSAWDWTWDFHPGCNGSTAIIHGDPHIETYDGKTYTCSNVGWFYLMYDDPNETYAIVGEFVKFKRRSRLKSILIDYLGHQYHLGQNLQLKVDGSNEKMPYWRWGEIFIYETAHSTIRAILSNWITIVWDGHNTAHISVQYLFSLSNTHALCGTYNGNQTDDFTKRDGTVTNNKNQFVTSWAYP